MDDQLIYLLPFHFHYAVCFVSTHLCAGRTDQYVITILAMIGKSGVAGAWSAVQVFSAEVFPTVIRWLYQ
jgi:hypothetical protein